MEDAGDNDEDDEEEDVDDEEDDKEEQIDELTKDSVKKPLKRIIAFNDDSDEDEGMHNTESDAGLKQTTSTTTDMFASQAKNTDCKFKTEDSGFLL